MQSGSADGERETLPGLVARRVEIKGPGATDRQRENLPPDQAFPLSLRERAGERALFVVFSVNQRKARPHRLSASNGHAASGTPHNESPGAWPFPSPTARIRERSPLSRKRARVGRHHAARDSREAKSALARQLPDVRLRRDAAKTRVPVIKLLAQAPVLPQHIRLHRQGLPDFAL